MDARPHFRRALLLTAVCITAFPLQCLAHVHKYEFTGHFASRTFEPDGAFDAAFPWPGMEFIGSIAIDMDHAHDRNPDPQVGQFSGVVKSIELQFTTPSDRLRYSRRLNGGSELVVNSGSSLGDREEIRATVFNVVTEGGITGVTLTLVGRAANRNALAAAGVDAAFTAIPAELWELQIRSKTKTPAGQPILVIGRLSAMRERAPDEGGMDTYENSDFPPRPDAPVGRFWFPGSGTWEVRHDPNVYYTNTSVEPFALSLFGGTLGLRREDGSTNEMVAGIRTDYSVEGFLSSRWKARGNTLGLVYNYVDPNNFYELRLFPSGIATVTKVISGERTLVSAARYRRGAEHLAGIDAFVRIQRSGFTTTIQVNDRILFRKLEQRELGGGFVGVFSSWNAIRFRNFQFKAHVPRLFPPDPGPHQFLTQAIFVFPFDLQLWTAHRGTWEIDRSIFSYANTRREPWALTSFSYGPPPIAADKTVDVTVFAEPAENSESSVGVVYELATENDHYDVALFDDGRAVAYEVAGGLRTPVAYGRWAGGLGRWLNVGIVRFAGKSSIEVDGERVFDELDQPPLASHEIGLTTNLKTAAFNHISLYWNSEF